MPTEVRKWNNPLTADMDEIVEGETEPANTKAEMLMLECDEHDGIIQIFNEDECE